MNIKLDISDFEHLWHTGSNVDVSYALENDSFDFVKGDGLKVFINKSYSEIKLGMYHIGESYLEALAGLQILKSEGYKAVLGCDYAPITEDAQSLTYWGYVIFTDMTLKFDSND